MQLPLSLVATLALRSLWAHKVKSAIVGSILFFGTFLVVLGTSLLDTIQGTMAQSVTSSLSGHLQVYSKDAQDELALFGGSLALGTPDNGEIESFAAVAPVLEAVPNVKAVVPMGLAQATIFGQSELDRVIGGLQAAAETGDEATLQAVIPQARRIATDLIAEASSLGKVATDPEKFERDMNNLRRVDSDALWKEFRQDPQAVISFLEQDIAPLAGDAQMMWLRMIGTDLQQFTQSFDRFYVVDGEPVPPGKRGVLLSKRTYERIVKNKAARELDQILEEVTLKGKVIADEPELESRIERNARQYARVTYGLDATKAAHIEEALRPKLPGVEGGIDALIQALLTVDDSNVRERHALFYEEVAPHIRLYEIPVGSTMPLRAYTRAGYVRSVNVKVYGTYEFKGLERSDLASASNLTDLVTFRELYGKMSPEQKAELEDIQKSVAVQEVSREDAEAALFGGDSELVAEAAPTEAFANLDEAVVGKAERVDDATYTREQMRDGLAINLAVILEDESRLQQTLLDAQKALDDAGLKLRVIDWRQASGMVGQFLFVVQMVLVIALIIIFVVALLIINNSMVMATLDRTGEIGTMRAIGAKRGLVVGLFIGETLTLALLSGGMGALAAAGLLTYWGQVGIPAVQDVLVVLFAGPRLYPVVGPQHVVFGLVSVALVGVVSTLYPALLAARIAPVVAMQQKE